MISSVSSRVHRLRLPAVQIVPADPRRIESDALCRHFGYATVTALLIGAVVSPWALVAVTTQAALCPTSSGCTA